MAYTDTDSFVLEITTKDLDDLVKLSTDFDFSNYPTTHKLHDVHNKKVLGKFKTSWLVM